MKVYVCENDYGVAKVTPSKASARDWLASEYYEDCDEEMISEVCDILNVNDLYEADLDDLIDYLADDMKGYVEECELEYMPCHCEKHEPEPQQPQKPEYGYTRRSL